MKYIILLLLTSFTAYAQRSQTITADCLKIGASGECITQAEFNRLDGVTSNIQTQLNSATSDIALKANDADVVHKAGNETVAGVKTFTGKITASSTANGFAPCPTMTTAQRDLVASPVAGDCVYNSSIGSLNIYDGSSWKSAGGGVNQWLTGTPYLINDVIIQSGKLYISLIAHTSGVFATDLAASRWLLLKAGVDAATDVNGVLPLANGGTNKNLTATAGRVIYSDADSFELSSAGTSGQILQSNGTSAPTFVNKSILGKNQSEGFSSVTEEVQAPNSQLTQTSGNNYLLETGNKNILANASFEDSTGQESWTSGAGTVVDEATIKIDGEKSLKVTLSAQALSIRQDSTRYAAQFADGVDGLVGAWVKTSLSNVYVCARRAGVSLVSSTFSNCVAVSSNNKWAFYQVPTILGATSNGVEVASYNSSGVSVAVTGDVYIDDAFAGAINTRGTTTLDTAWTACTFSTLAWQGLGTVTNNLQCRRLGPDLLMRGNFTTGTTAASVVQIPLPTWNGASLTSTSGVASAEIVGRLARNSGTANAIKDYTVGSNPSSSVLFVSYPEYSLAASPLTAQTGSSMFATGEIQSFQARIPIAGWSSNSDYYSASCGANCVDTFSAKVSAAGVVSGENVDWINGNCTVSTSVFTCTHNSGIFTQEPNCTVNTDTGTGGTTAQLRAASSSSLTEYATYDSAGGLLAQGANIICQKQGADFTASRTIVGSFKEVVTAPGVTKPKTCYYAFGGASATLASPTECTTGTCVEVVDTCGTGTPPTYAATGGFLNLTFASGTFANSSPINCKCEAWDTTAGQPRKCLLYFDTSDNSWATNSSGGYVVNGAGYDNGGGAVSHYTQVSCEGSAP